LAQHQSCREDKTVDRHSRTAEAEDEEAVEAVAEEAEWQAGATPPRSEVQADRKRSGETASSTHAGEETANGRMHQDSCKITQARLRDQKHLQRRADVSGITKGKHACSNAGKLTVDVRK
jgi:hypothetical protein